MEMNFELIIFSLGLVVVIIGCLVPIIKYRCACRKYRGYMEYYPSDRSIEKYRKADAERFDKKCEEWKMNHPDIENLFPLSDLPHRVHDRKIEELEHVMEIRRMIREKYPEYSVIRIEIGSVIDRWGTFQREDNLYSVEVYEIIAHVKNMEGQTKNLTYHAFARYLCIV